jgi:hypothetical protein
MVDIDSSSDGCGERRLGASNNQENDCKQCHNASKFPLALCSVFSLFHQRNDTVDRFPKKKKNLCMRGMSGNKVRTAKTATRAAMTMSPSDEA